MNLRREYLRFYNSGSAWTVYAARNQNLFSVPVLAESKSGAEDLISRQPQVDEARESTIDRGEFEVPSDSRGGEKPLSNPVTCRGNPLQPASAGKRRPTKAGLGIILALAFLLTAATQPPNHAYVLPGKIAAEWTFHGESRVWLEIHSANSRDWPEEGYNASFTFITVKDCVPVVRKLGDGRYEIAFRSEIAKDLP